MRRDLRRRLHVVVLAGGAGERFWPASRRSHPKPFLRVVGGRTLLEATLSRARRLVAPDRVWVVGGREHARALRAAAGLARGRLLIEPRRRNTALACAWAAHRIRQVDPDAVLVVLPADHHIPDARAFAADLARAAEAADRARSLVTLGIVPTRPDTGYGYIRSGRELGPDHPGLHVVERFVEKPDARRAARFLERGGYVWNAGIFVWRADVFLDELAAHEPRLHRALAPFRRRGRATGRADVDAVYRRAPSLPVDVAVLERSRRVWTLPVTFAWSDVGTWQSLAEQLGVGEGAEEGADGEVLWLPRGAEASGGKGGPVTLGNRVVSGRVLGLDARSNLILGGRRLVALVGVEDLAIIDSEDVILVTKLDRGQDVRSLVKELQASGRERLT